MVDCVSNCYIDMYMQSEEGYNLYTSPLYVPIYLVCYARSNIIYTYIYNTQLTKLFPFRYLYGISSISLPLKINEALKMNRW